MPKELWWVWMILAAFFSVAEIFTAGFFLLWFGVGAAVAGLLALMGFSPAMQMTVFIVLSGVLFAVSRRFAERWTQKQPSQFGVERLIGQKGVVLESIDNIKGTGHIRVEREEWRADSDTGSPIPEGTVVAVIRIDGTHLVVREVDVKEEE